MQAFLSSIAVVAAILVALYQLRGLYPRSRIRLKSDLEILHLLPEDSEERKLIESSISAAVKAIYGDGKFVIHSWSDLLFGILLMLGGTWGTIALALKGDYLWSLFPVIFVILGSGGVMNAFDPEE